MLGSDLEHSGIIENWRQSIMVDVQPYLQKIVDQFDNPKVQTSLKGFTRTMLFRFTDTKEDWLIKTVDGKEATMVKDSHTNPDLTITTTVDVLTGVMDRRINGMAAYMQRKIQIKGSMEDLMKLQKLLL
jgi:putative sterol carrier protein